jgi:hypothetical protein
MPAPGRERFYRPGGMPLSALSLVFVGGVVLALFLSVRRCWRSRRDAAPPPPAHR